MVKVNILYVFKPRCSTFINSMNSGVSGNIFISMYLFRFCGSYTVLGGPKLHKTVLKVHLYSSHRIWLTLSIIFQNRTISKSLVH